MKSTSQLRRAQRKKRMENPKNYATLTYFYPFRHRSPAKKLFAIALSSHQLWQPGNKLSKQQQVNSCEKNLFKNISSADFSLNRDEW